MPFKKTVFFSKVSLFFILFVSLAFLVGNDASAVEDNLFEEQTIRLGYFYRPSFQEGMQDDEQKNGFGYEYLQKISYLSGWRYEYVYGTFETLFEKLKSGEIDILAGVRDTKERRGLVNFSDFIMSQEDGENYYICTAKRRTDLLKKLNSTLSLIDSTEPFFLQELTRKYWHPIKLTDEFPGLIENFVQKHNVLKIGYFDNYLPYCDTLPSGKATGSMVDIMNGILSKVNLSDKIELEYKPYDDYSDLIKDLNSKKVDMIFPCSNESWFAEQNGMYLSRVVVDSGMNIAYLKNYNSAIFEKISVNKNNILQYQYTRAYFPDAEIVLCTSIDDCLKAVIDGEAGSTIINSFRSGTILKNRIYNDILFQPLSTLDERCFGVRVGNPELLRILNRGIYELGYDFGINVSYNYTDGLYKYSIFDFLGDNIDLVLVCSFFVILLIVLFFISRQIRLKKQTEKDRKTQFELQSALKNANLANKAKTDFLNNMSHDIRTPMNAIIGFTTLARDYADDGEKVKEYLDKIMLSGKNLLSLVNDVLDMNRVESGQIQLEENKCTVSEIMENLRVSVEPEALAKSQSFVLDYSKIKNNEIACDKLRLYKILLNVLSNAVKYTQNGGTIILSACQKPCQKKNTGLFEFYVKDNGIGMDGKFVKEIFEPFSREHNSTECGILGTGLGMSIAKNLCDIMHGKIDVKSEKNRGTQVRITVPLHLRSDVSDSKSIHLNLREKNVLLVEDNELNCEIATEMLERTGVKVFPAKDGIQAIKMFEESGENFFSMVFMDIQMPNMNGYEASKKIRSLDRSDAQTVPVVAMSANAFENEPDFIESGMSEFISKPVKIKLLYAIMEKYL